MPRLTSPLNPFEPDTHCDGSKFEATLVLPKSFVIEPEFNDLMERPLVAQESSGSQGACSVKQVKYRLYPTYKVEALDYRLCGVTQRVRKLKQVPELDRGIQINTDDDDDDDDDDEHGEIADENSESKRGRTLMRAASWRHKSHYRANQTAARLIDETVFVLNIRFPIIKSLRTDEDTYATLICSPKAADLELDSGSGAPGGQKEGEAQNRRGGEANRLQFHQGNGHQLPDWSGRRLSDSGQPSRDDYHDEADTGDERSRWPSSRVDLSRQRNHLRGFVEPAAAEESGRSIRYSRGPLESAQSNQTVDLPRVTTFGGGGGGGGQMSSKTIGSARADAAADGPLGERPKDQQVAAECNPGTVSGLDMKCSRPESAPSPAPEEVSLAADGRGRATFGSAARPSRRSGAGRGGNSELQSGRPRALAAPVPIESGSGQDHVTGGHNESWAPPWSSSLSARPAPIGTNKTATRTRRRDPNLVAMSKTAQLATATSTEAPNKTLGELENNLSLALLCFVAALLMVLLMVAIIVDQNFLEGP